MNASLLVRVTIEYRYPDDTNSTAIKLTIIAIKLPMRAAADEFAKSERFLVKILIESTRRAVQESNTTINEVISA